MTRLSKRIGIITALALTGLMAVGVTTASAKGPRGPKGPSASVLVTEAATQLKVARADLKAAIVKSAEDRVDAAVGHLKAADGDDGRRQGPGDCMDGPEARDGRGFGAVAGAGVSGSLLSRPVGWGGFG